MNNRIHLRMGRTRNFQPLEGIAVNPSSVGGEWVEFRAKVQDVDREYKIAFNGQLTREAARDLGRRLIEAADNEEFFKNK